MRDEKQVWTINWTQAYASWPKSDPQEQDSRIEDLTLAREVLARIMSK